MDDAAFVRSCAKSIALFTKSMVAMRDDMR